MRSNVLRHGGEDALTLVMYHYVRPVPDRNGFSVKGFTPEEFEGQLDYIGRHYSVCALADVVATAKGEAELPPRPCVLTFDDGLAEHAAEVWPSLRRRGWTGAFFASARATLERRFLDVHRIHVLLASDLDPHALRTELDGLIRDHAAPGVPTVEELWSRYGRASRFDPAEIIFFKRTLQKGLPENVRVPILAELFRRHIAEDETILAEDFYLSLDDLQAMVADGMEVGGHGIRHEWLDVASDIERAHEVHGTIDLLRQVHDGQIPERWLFSYPYGAYNQRTIDLLASAGCAAAVTVEVDLATRCTSLLELPRLDANDLPTDAFAPMAPWTVRAETMESAGVSTPVKQSAGL